MMQAQSFSEKAAFRPRYVRRQSSTSLVSRRRSSLLKNDPAQEKILWSSVSRNNVILAEAGEDPFEGAVSQAAHGILSKKFTPGWEFHTHKTNKKNNKSENSDVVPVLKAMKFHIYEHHSGEWDDAEESEPIVWVFAAVYNPESVHFENYNEVVPAVKNFLQKIIGLTAMERLEDPAWRTGSTLACQETFAPTLLQRMQEVTYLGKLARVQQSLQDTTNLMQNNITAILDREDQLNDLDRRASNLTEMSMAFKKSTKAVRRRMMMQNAKYGAVLGGTVTVVVAAVVVPPILVAL